MTDSNELAAPPEVVGDFADQAVEYIRRSLEMTVEYNSETLPLLDHYLSTLKADEATTGLVAAAVGAYFGEVVRRAVGGSWLIPADDDPATWRFVLPGGLSFAPVAVALAAVRRDDGELDAGFDAPQKMKEHLDGALSRMGEVTEEEYYSLCGRFDTIEHIQSVLLAIAHEEARKRN